MACPLGSGNAICSSGSVTACRCWQYTGANAGTVSSLGVPAVCACPSGGAGWD
jgi:hypothetical protein